LSTVAAGIDVSSACACAAIRALSVFASTM
jgi:hypothetical protein